MSSVKTRSMPAMSAPSIVQQRLILIGFFVVISAVVWWQNAGGGSDHPARTFSTTPVPEVVAEIDFTSAEASWSGLSIDSQGNLRIDAVTESALLGAIALLDDQHSDLQMERIALLLEKQFGANVSQQFMELLPVLKNYREIEKRWWEENGSNNMSADKPPPYEDLFQLQDEVLGETLATKLFSKQRRLAKVMLASQAIRNDPGLNQAEKDQALKDLQKAFQKSAPNE